MRRISLALVALAAAGVLTVAPAAGAPEQTPRRGGTLVVATIAQAEPSCLNPFVEACGFPSPLDMGLSEVLAGAFEITPDATFRPNLVGRATVVSRQPVTLEYHIRPEARWSDGVPVTASDFVFTHQAALRHLPPGHPYGATVRSVRALDPTTFKVVLRFPFPDWRVLFDQVLPRHALVGEDFESLWQDRIDNPKTGELIGSGPFLMRLQRGRQLTLVRNPRYWGPHAAYLDRIVFRFLSPEDTAAAMRRSDVDMINPTSSVLQAQAHDLLQRRDPGVRVLSVLRSAWDLVAIRSGPGGHPALENPLVRQALAYGIDRVAIARTIGEQYLGSRAALEPLDSFVFLADSPYYQPNWKGYRYRPARARRLLEQAGCRRGDDGIYSCGGDRLSLWFVTPAGTERRARTLELAQAQLAQVGVEVRPTFVLPSASNATFERGDFDLALYNWVNFASTVGPWDILGCQRPFNYMGYCDRLVTRDLERATRILDVGARVKLLNRIDARLAKAVPALPVFQDKRLFALRATIRGVVPNGAGFFTWDSENWWLADRP